MVRGVLCERIEADTRIPASGGSLFGKVHEARRETTPLIYRVDGQSMDHHRLTGVLPGNIIVLRRLLFVDHDKAGYMSLNFDKVHLPPLYVVFQYCITRIYIVPLGNGLFVHVTGGILHDAPYAREILHPGRPDVWGSLQRERGAVSIHRTPCVLGMGPLPNLRLILRLCPVISALFAFKGVAPGDPRVTSERFCLRDLISTDHTTHGRRSGHRAIPSHG